MRVPVVGIGDGRQFRRAYHVSRTSKQEWNSAQVIHDHMQVVHEQAAFAG